jgi:uncharacterized membrane protein
MESLRLAPLSRRVLCCTLLATFGVGYLMALIYMYAKEVRPHRLEGHGLVQSVANTYHGIPGDSPLIASLRGSMAAAVNAEELAAIVEWVEAGYTEESYSEKVGPIIESNCVSCHGADGPYFPPLTSYAEVSEFSKPGGGISPGKLARQTHVHLLGIPMLLFIMSWMFVQTRYSERLKSVLIVMPFFGVLFDVAHWWITKLNPDAAAGVIFGGILMNLGFAAQWFMTAWDVLAPMKREAGGSERESL